MSVRKGSSAVVLLAVLTALLALPATGSTAGTAVSTGAGAGASVSDALHFWTPARMRAAQPIDMVREGGAELARPSAVAPAVEGGRLLGGAEQAVAEFAEVADTTAPGFRQNGAIFFELPRGQGLARCSGTSVDAPNMSVVFTAGHCVNEGGPRQWFDRNWVFVPGYHDGVRPFGIFVARWLGATEPWIAGASENADVGAAVVMRNERDQRLGAAVGGYGIAWNLPARQVFDVHGYPAAPPFDGDTQRLCTAKPFLGHDLASFLWLGPLNLALTCRVTGGGSGGAWTIHGDVLNSVTNYGYSDDPATNFGAYFGGAVRDLYRQAARVR
jgi:hypothetical protein